MAKGRGSSTRPSMPKRPSRGRMKTTRVNIKKAENGFRIVSADMEDGKGNYDSKDYVAKSAKDLDALLKRLGM